jgi:hypothetical protein
MHMAQSASSTTANQRIAQADGSAAPVGVVRCVRERRMIPNDSLRGSSQSLSVGVFDEAAMA